MAAEDKNSIFDNYHLETIAEMIRDIKFGNVTVIVQDGKIIQIDKTEKLRVRN